MPSRSCSILQGRVAAWLCATAVALAATPGAAQQLVLTPALASGTSPLPRPVVVFPDLGANLATPARTYIAPTTGTPLATHGLALVAADRALVTQESTNTVDLLDTAAGTRIDTLTLPTLPPNAPYDGFGTLAVNPARTHVLAFTGNSTLWVIAAPFDHTATVTSLTLPAAGGTAQTRAVAFDSSTGRAFVVMTSGIAVLDPPYTAVAFVIPGTNGVPATPIGPQIGAIAMAPDNATLVVSRQATGSTMGPELRIFHAPFTAASTPDVLTIAGANLDGMTFTPDGSQLLVVEFQPQPAPALPRVYVVNAPYGPASSVATLAFDTGGQHAGFEDIDISADGQLAALSGAGGIGDPFVVLKAPFTAAGFSASVIPIPQFHFPYSGTPGRGNGTARFWATATAAQPPQLWVDVASTDQGPTGGVTVDEGNSGTTDAVATIDLSGPSPQTVTVDYATADGTQPGGATVADNDYVPATGTVTFAPGETSKTVTVKVVGDTKYESNERFKLVISNPVNATLLGVLPGFADTATIVILNDDAVVPATITTSALPDGTTGVPYSFQLTGTGALPLTWSITSNFATVLPPGLALDAATGVISGIPLLPLSINEFVQVTDNLGAFANKTLPFTITGSPLPVLQAAPNPRDFGTRAVGTTSLSQSITVQNPGYADLVFPAGFGATSVGSDFALVSGVTPCTPGIPLAPGGVCQLHYTFTPQAPGPRSEAIALVTNAAPVTLTLTGTGSGGALPTVSIADAAPVTEGNSGTRPMTFAVTLSAPSASAVTVHYAATGGTATAGSDYTVAGTGTLTFAAGVTSQTVTVDVIGDLVVEPDETVVIALSTPNGATLGTASASGTIINDDAPAGPLLVVTGTPLAFGSQLVGTTSAVRAVNVRNSGDQDLVLANPFAAVPAGDFAAAAGAGACSAGATLSPSATCTLYFTFTPSASGPRGANVLLASNAPDVTLTITGTGVGRAPPPPPPAQPVPTLAASFQWLLAVWLAVVGAVALWRRHPLH